MDPDFWLQRWQHNQIGFHQEQVNTHLERYWGHLQLPANGRVFVPLCGKSRDLLWLRAQGHEVLGIEISPIAVRDFFAENDLVAELGQQGAFQCWRSDGIELLLGDYFDLQPDDLAGCRAVFDRASLIALPREMRIAYRDRMLAIAPAGAPTLLITLEYPQQQMDGPPFSVLQDEVGSLYGQSHHIELLQDFDALAENPNLRAKGLTRLQERVYRLLPRMG